MLQFFSIDFSMLPLALGKVREPLVRKEVNNVASTYELLYILNPQLGEEGLEAMDERIQGIINANGEVKNVDIWGVRQMAYEIQDQKEGYYVVLHFTAEPDFPVELERQLRIFDQVMRYLITSVEE